MINYGEALKYQREINGYSQNALAKATGLRQPMISYYEANRGLPSIECCVQLAQFYGITLDELVGLSEPTDAVKELDLPTKKQTKAVAFANEYSELINDGNFQNIAKLCNNITPELRAVMLGYIIGMLQSQGINTQQILNY